MKNLFQIATWFFFFLSICIWIFLLRWEILFSMQAYKIIKNILLPGYLIITWLMIWYLTAKIWSKQDDDTQKVYTKSFIIWIVSGVILALSYMFI